MLTFDEWPIFSIEISVLFNKDDGHDKHANTV